MRVLAIARRRVVEALITLLGASVLIWALMPLAPGSPARMILVAQGIPEPTPQQISDLERALHLDQPLLSQYVHWLWGAVRGDFGLSFASGRPVSDELAGRLPATLTLAAASLVLALVLSVALGVAAAQFPGRWPDHGTRGLALLFASIPGFVIALLLIQVFVVGFGVGKAALDGTWQQVWMPALCLAVGLSDTWSRLLRANLLAFMETPTAQVLAARGASRRRILWRHGLPNSAVPSLHALAVGVAILIGGATVVETVFTWPGLGSYVVESVKHRDLPVIQAFTVFATLSYIVTSVAADIVSAVVDRRITVDA
ncbi:ABC transporter permease [Rhodococcus triatomae]|uniref:Peptide/nickel transport system permease protein/nickel transport system permease protein n=1 Tax=Rhodococcus triatomae TaxID=300028 RepID=A0A1G8M6A4_9NOCA|nr:ABC transporter permease [Rhodococcus triatomae]QNG18182.1 ABC transporter permease [Rhodococcus triatomae]QNG22148.1 ABC transporter permease [Rhodococcus triatomae]SDI63489.1 peptide/nickel transport system permease protein/nickel transport system permease protein [Rhodococcus triatomae]